MTTKQFDYTMKQFAFAANAVKKARIYNGDEAAARKACIAPYNAALKAMAAMFDNIADSDLNWKMAIQLGVNESDLRFQYATDADGNRTVQAFAFLGQSNPLPFTGRKSLYKAVLACMFVAKPPKYIW